MNLYDESSENFLDIICQQIKSKSIHKKIRKEYRDHLNDQAVAYMEKGISKKQALEIAIKEMGNPIEIGNNLNKVHKPLISYSTILIILMFIAVSSLIQYLFSYSLTAKNIGPIKSIDFIKYSLAGIILFIGIYFSDYTWLKKHPIPCYFTFITLMILTSIIVSEYTTVYLFLLFIPVYGNIVYSLRNTKFTGIVTSIIAFFPAAIIYNYNSLYYEYPFTVISLSCLAILSCAILKGYFNCNKLIKISTIIFNFIILLWVIVNIYSKGYALSEIEDVDGWNFSSYIVKESINNAEPFSETRIGLDSTPNLIDSVVIDWNMDKTLLYVNSKYGYVPALLMTLLLLYLVFSLIKLHYRQKNGFGTLLSLGCVSAVSLQIIISILCNLGLFESRISSIPLISYGSGNFIVNMIFLGLILSIYRRSNIVDDNIYNDSSYVYYENGKLVFNIRYYKN